MYTPVSVRDREFTPRIKGFGLLKIPPGMGMLDPPLKLYVPVMVIESPSGSV